MKSSSNLRFLLEFLGYVYGFIKVHYLGTNGNEFRREKLILEASGTSLVMWLF